MPIPMLPQAAEDVMVKLFEDCNLCAIHAKRVTISEFHLGDVLMQWLCDFPVAFGACLLVCEAKAAHACAWLLLQCPRTYS